MGVHNWQTTNADIQNNSSIYAVIFVTYVQISWWTDCSNSLLLRIARSFPSLFTAQKGVSSSVLDSQISDLHKLFLKNFSFDELI